MMSNTNNQGPQGPQVPPPVMEPFPVPIIVSGAIAQIDDGVVCVAQIVTPNAVLILRTTPQEMKNVGEALINLGIKGAKAPIVPQSSLIVPS